MELFIVSVRDIFSHSFEITMSLGAECCVFGIVGNKEELGMGCAGSSCGQPGLRAPCLGTEELLPHHGQQQGKG